MGAMVVSMAVVDISVAKVEGVEGELKAVV